MGKQLRQKYKNPPVIEVAASVQFEALKAFKPSHIDNLWGYFGKDKYPHDQYLNALHKMGYQNDPDNIQLNVVQLDQFVPMRTWFLSDNRTTLIQFQSDRIIFNWRKVKENTDNNYSCYEDVAERLFGALGSLDAFVKKELKSQLKFEMMELLYCNSIPFSDFGGISKVEDCITMGLWRINRDILPAPHQLNFQWGLRLPEIRGEMKINGASGQRVPDGTDVLRLDFEVRGIPEKESPDAESLKKWFNSAHDYIIDAFQSVTTEHMHSLWGKQ